MEEKALPLALDWGVLGFANDSSASTEPILAGHKEASVLD